MKIQLDTSNKIIRVEQNSNFGELIKYLDKLLPKNSPLGYWKDFTLETNTVIYNWSSPIVYDWGYPFYTPTFCPATTPFVTGDTILGNAGTVETTVFNFELN